MVNRYTTTITIGKGLITDEKDAIEQAVRRAKLKRPLITPENITDILVNEEENVFIIGVNWWPDKKGDQI